MNEELNYRPFRNLEEFLKYFKEGDTLDFYNGFNKFSGIFVGYKQGGCEDKIVIATKNFLVENEIEINLNNERVMLSLQMKINDGWQPFGVLDEN